MNMANPEAGGYKNNQNFDGAYLITINALNHVNLGNWEIESHHLTMEIIIRSDEYDEMIILNEDQIINCSPIFNRYKLTDKSFTFNYGKCKVFLTDKYCDQFVIDDNLYTIKVDKVKIPKTVN